MRLKRLLLCLLTLAIVLSMAPAAGAAFADTHGHWAEKAIDAWSGYDVVQDSDGNF